MSSETDGKGESDGRTNFDVGMVEPGIQRFLEERKRSGASETSVVDYVKNIGSARKLAQRPILELSKDELRALDLKLVERAKSTRTILKMFLNDNERPDLNTVLRRQRRPKARKAGLDECLMPDEIMRLVGTTKSLRDAAFVATLYASGARISEVLNLRVEDIKRVNGSGIQLWLGRVKSSGQERYCPPIGDPWKSKLEAYLKMRAAPKGSVVFPSTTADNKPMDRRTVRELLDGLCKRAGVSKRHNPHWLRHSRISIAFANREADLATLCVYFWGIPVTTMANRYSHFSGLDTRIAEAQDIELAQLPVFPVPPIIATQKQVGELTARMESMRKEITEEVLAKFADALRKSGVTVLDHEPTPEEVKKGATVVRWDTES